PQSNQYCNNTVFDWKIKQGNLVVTDHNSDKVQTDYYYVINFDNNVASVDPIYNNGGTSRSGFGLTPSMEFGAIVLAVAIGVLAVWQIMKARAVPKADDDSISR
ncbi:MAG TPA: hypothetical protein VE820_02300, partial [Sphingomicrobium sp.]|nr:hypothetical protein [Sphingomicrobium sp.]